MCARHTVKQFARRHCKLGQTIRLAAIDRYTAGDGICYEWKARGKIINKANLFLDWEYSWFRARRSAGWKNSKRRHQWEH